MTVYKRLKRLPDDAPISDKKAAFRFVRDRRDHLIATIESTASIELFKVLEQGGKLDPKKGKRQVTKYKISHLPFLEAKREAARLMKEEPGRIKNSPALAREVAAITIADDYALNRAEMEAVERQRAELKAEARKRADDPHARELANEKALGRLADRFNEVWEDEGLTTLERRLRVVDVLEKFTERLLAPEKRKRRAPKAQDVIRESLKLARQKIKDSEEKQASESISTNIELPQAQSYQQDKGPLGTVKRTQKGDFSPYPKQGEMPSEPVTEAGVTIEEKNTDTSLVTSPIIQKQGNKTAPPTASPAPISAEDEMKAANNNAMQTELPHESQAEPCESNTVASVKMFITRTERQQLADLGYSREAIDRMRPEEGAQIIEQGRTARAAPIEPPSDDLTWEEIPLL